MPKTKNKIFAEHTKILPKKQPLPHKQTITTQNFLSIFLTPMVKVN